MLTNPLPTPSLLPAPARSRSRVKEGGGGNAAATMPQAKETSSGGAVTLGIPTAPRPVSLQLYKQPKGGPHIFYGRAAAVRKRLETGLTGGGDAGMYPSMEQADEAAPPRGLPAWTWAADAPKPRTCSPEAGSCAVM